MKNQRKLSRFILISSLIIFSLLFTSCAARMAYKQGLEAERTMNWDKAIYHYTVALQKEPENVAYRLSLDKARLKSSYAHLARAKELFNQGKAIESFGEFKLAIDLDGTNQNTVFLYNQAREKFRKKLDNERRKRREKMRKQLTRGVPLLDMEAPGRLELNFENKRVKEIYTAICKLAGINVFFEGTLKNNLTGFQVKDVSFLEAIETFAMTHRHQIKVINTSTLFIFPDTAQMRKDYQSQVLRVFFFDNLPAKNARDYFRTIIGFTRFHHSDDLNALIVRGTPGQIAAAEKLAEIIDRPKAEVILDVEVLEVSRNDLNNVGLLFGSDYKLVQSTRSIIPSGETDGIPSVGSNQISFAELKNLSSPNLFLTIPSLTMNFLRQDSDTRLIAKPQIKVLDREKAKMHIGDSVPIRQSTFNPASTMGGNVVPIDSYTYKDIGIKLEFEPVINSQLEVTLKLKIELSSKLSENEAGLPTFGKKEITSVIRLRDGETNMIAGLIKENNRTTVTGIAGLSQIPLLGSLFSSNSNEVIKQDTIITITPYIIRSSEITPDDLKAVLIGTESNIGLALSDILNNKPDEEAESVVIDNQKMNELLKGEDASANTLKKTVPATDNGSQLDIEEPQPERPDLDDESGTALVSIQPSVISVTEGSQFSVQIVIQGAENVAHTPFYLIFDPNFVEIVNVTQGAFLSQDGSQVSFLHHKNNSTGELRVGLSRLGAAKGVAGKGVLAVITFKAKGKGKTYINFTNCSVKNPRAENMASEFMMGEIVID